MNESDIDNDEHKKKDQHDIVYALRTSQQHHVQLGLMADQKANIILGSFLIFITVTQGLIEKNDALFIPLWILTSFYSLAAIFGLLVIMPRFRDKRPDPGRPPANLLFFGSFNSMKMDDYIHTMMSRLQSNEDAREMMLKDIYMIGQVLQKKYTNLRISYSLLGLGIICSLIAYCVRLL